MAERQAKAIWEGTLREGRGSMQFGNGLFEGPFSFASRFEDGMGTNPEELLGAALAGCFSMALSAELGNAGYLLNRVATQAHVSLGRIEGKFRITKIHLVSEAEIPGIDLHTFTSIAEGVRTGCPVANALQGVEITLSAHLL